VWRFILPVKGRGLRKTRLGGSEAAREELSVAMFQDCLLAVQESALGPVVVVSPDTAILALADRAGATPLDHSGGLNAAVRAAAGSSRCAALLPDLPALRGEHLVRVLSEGGEGFVPDFSGRGTTLLFGQRLRPHFGPGSAAAHAAVAYPRIELEECGLTVDVDTADDLARAEHLGLGPHTAAILARSGADPTLRTGP
jgi:2-phospho-L-lactate guanylyltransferase